MKKLYSIFLAAMAAYSSATAQAPGGVSGGNVWVRADAGVTASGTNITGIANQLNNTNNFVGAGNPQLAVNNINFNPSIVFRGTNYLRSAATVLPANSNYTKFVVFKYDGVGTNNILSAGGSGNNAFFGNNTTTSLAIFHGGISLNAPNVVTASRYYIATAGFQRSTTNGTYIRVDGSTKVQGTVATGYLASTMQLGAYRNGNNLTGRIAETIIFPSALGASATATQQIESYLGLKYGISLAHDYLAADGTTTTYSITGFPNNIAGLGRDAASALYQKQGQSINTTTSQVVMALGNITATNQANANTIAADKQFLIWGDDNGSIATTAAVTGWANVANRLTRIWKLQNTNSFNQQVAVYYPSAALNPIPGTKYLIYNTSATLAGSGTEVISSGNATINGVAYTRFLVTFPTTGTLYFSFGSKPLNPANVGPASVWIKADDGINGTGSNITSWVNQVNTGNSFNGTSNPQLTAGQVNFNPAVTFSGSNYLTSAANVLPANSNYTKFVVFKYDGSTANNIISSAAPGNNALYSATTNTNLVMFHGGAILTASNVVNATRYYLGTAGFQSGSTNGTYIKVDGATRITGTSSATYVASAMQLGAHNNGSNLTGRIAEAIVYPSALAAGSTGALQVESYLGLKYGITLGHDYLASDGATITYPIATFANNIAGIGRDDDAALYQKQSQSINTAPQLVMALGTAAANNATNNNVIAADKQFLIWGDDNASIATTTAVAGWANATSRLTRIWKLQNTNSFSQQVTVYIPTGNINILPGTKYLMYHTSSTLAGGGTEVTGATTTTINGVAYTGFQVTFPTTGTLYFSFGSKAIYPGNITANAAVWVRADEGITATGTNVTNWANQVSSTNHFTGTGNPQLKDGALNFNPTITFSGSNYLTSAANAPLAGNYTKFVVFRATGTGNLASAGTTGGTGALYTPNQTFAMYHNGIIGATPANTINPGRQYLGTAVFNSGTGNGSLLRLNGLTATAFTSSTAHTASRLQIGSFITASSLPAGSDIAEAIVYNAALPATSLRQIESYLALKYGMTLQTDYLASDGTTTTYAISGYANNIAGIGRDDNTALNQLQSQSINEGSQLVAAVGAIANTNIENTNSISSDRQFLVWGDDNAPGYTINMGINQKRLSRVWKVQNTNSLAEAITIYYPVNGLNGLGISPTLIYANTAVALSNGSATIVTAGEIATFNGEDYQSFSVSLPATGTFYLSFAADIRAEICDNGIDDDLDGYIDGLDTDCTPMPTCTAAANPLTAFGIRQEWVSTTTNALATSVSPTIADLDGDGIPEILTVRAGGTGITYFKGDGSNATKNTIDYNIQLPVSVNQSTMQAAVADIDRDGTPEVIVVGSDRYVYVFNNESGSASVYKYRSESLVDTRFFNGSPRVVDIDEDGTPEIVVGLDVFQFNLAKGRLVKVVNGSLTAPSGAERTVGSNNWGNEIVVADIMPNNPGKEIVAGSQVYAVNLNTGATTVLANLSTIAGSGVIPVNDDGPTAVADMDNNGSLDIVYVSTTSVVIWDPAAGVLKTKQAYPDAGLLRGLPTIANVYNEQSLNGSAADWPEVIFTSPNHLLAYNLHKTTGPVWNLATSDNSGETGVTAFDLNGDGVLEIIYNDETNIRVINGNTNTPANVATFASGTATWMEHPVVADVDGDGGAEFVCVSFGNTAFTGMLRVFGPATGTSAWQNARKIWNGRGYRSVSINDDLTIPVTEQDIKLQYPVASGRYPFNVFNCQIDARQLDPGLIAATELSVSSLVFDSSASSCTFRPAAATLNYIVTNNGSGIAPVGTPISFYRGNPTLPGAARISAVDTLAGELQVGASVEQTVVLNLSAFTPPYTIYAVVNDNGSQALPISLPVIATNVKECDYTNNMSTVLVAPAVFDYGNLNATWPVASASVVTTDAAWLGIGAPNTECAPILTDPADGLTITNAAGGSGSNAAPWLLTSGVPYNLQVTVNGNGTAKPVFWAVWYDVNGNGDFTDAEDLFQTGNTTHGSPVSTSFSMAIPTTGSAAGARFGRIRVIGTAIDPGFTQGMNGTGEFINGEVEDFFVSYATPLPLSLLSFNAEKKGADGLLTWQTASEQNTDHFIVTASRNGLDFKEIGKVAAAGNSSIKRSYNFTDPKLAAGAHYYRLQVMDKDGSYHYSNVVSLTTDRNGEIMGITALPNPVTDIVNVSGLQGSNNIMLSDATGRVIATYQTSASQQQIDMVTYPKGIYMLKVVDERGTVTNIKVVKN